jgi:hypothetical protein
MNATDRNIKITLDIIMKNNTFKGINKEKEHLKTGNG